MCNVKVNDMVSVPNLNNGRPGKVIRLVDECQTAIIDFGDFYAKIKYSELEEVEERSEQTQGGDLVTITKHDWNNAFIPMFGRVHNEMDSLVTVAVMAWGLKFEKKLFGDKDSACITDNAFVSLLFEECSPAVLAADGHFDSLVDGFMLSALLLPRLIPVVETLILKKKNG